MKNQHCLVAQKVEYYLFKIKRSAPNRNEVTCFFLFLFCMLEQIFLSNSLMESSPHSLPSSRNLPALCYNGEIENRKVKVNRKGALRANGLEDHS